jgi:hypothetical protein
VLEPGKFEVLDDSLVTLTWLSFFFDFLDLLASRRLCGCYYSKSSSVTPREEGELDSTMLLVKDEIDCSQPIVVDVWLLKSTSGVNGKSESLYPVKG